MFKFIKLFFGTEPATDAVTLNAAATSGHSHIPRRTDVCHGRYYGGRPSRPPRTPRWHSRYDYTRRP